MDDPASEAPSSPRALRPKVDWSVLRSRVSSSLLFDAGSRVRVRPPFRPEELGVMITEGQRTCGTAYVAEKPFQYCDVSLGKADQGGRAGR